MATNKTLMQSESPVTTTDSRPVPDPTALTTQQITMAVDAVRELFDAKLTEMAKAVLLLQQAGDRRPTIGEVSLKLDEKFQCLDDKFGDVERYISALIDNGKLRVAELAGIHGTMIVGLEKRLDHKYVETAADLTHLRDLLSERIDGLEELFKIIRNDERFTSVWSGIKAERERSDQQFLRVDQQFVQLEKLAAQLKIAGDTAVAAALQAQKEAAGEQTKSSAAAIAKSENSTSESIRQLQTLFQTSIAGLNNTILDVKSRLDKGEGGSAGRSAATDDSRYERGARRDEASDNRGMISIIISVAAVVVVVLLHFMKP